MEGTLSRSQTTDARLAVARLTRGGAHLFWSVQAVDLRCVDILQTKVRMSKDPDVQPLIERIRTRTKGEIVTSGAEALLHAIPYAGGVVASILGEYATHRRIEKVCDVLSDLNARLERDHADPERHLSKDQIVQVVHETLQTASTTSDDEKIAALKQGLGYAFLSSDSFEHKELMLQVLRATTALELRVLPVVYNMDDPFLIHEIRPSSHSPIDSLVSPNIVAASRASAFHVPEGTYVPVGNRVQPGAKTLLECFVERTRIAENMLEATLRLLDGKGLTNAGPNLHRRDSTVLHWKAAPPYGVTLAVSVSSLTTIGSEQSAERVERSPLESSRTKFGEEFLRFCTRSF